jgi:hypothetical protein
MVFNLDCLCFTSQIFQLMKLKRDKQGILHPKIAES